jgi:SAM-dependent methyltransferase
MTMSDLHAEQYGGPYEALLRSTASSQQSRAALLRHLCARVQPEGPARALDVGAGSGDGVACLLEHLPGVELTALEPDARGRRRLEERFRGRAGLTLAQVPVQRWLREPAAPSGFHLILLLHVLYHLPRGTWEEVLTQLAGRLAPSGALVVSLKAPESPCNQMIRHLGGRPADIVAFFQAWRPPGHFVVAFTTRWPVQAESLEELEQVLRFMLADVAWERPPEAEQVRRYAREHFQRGEGRWGFDIPEHTYVVTPSEALARRIAQDSPVPARSPEW